jgi:hypothetical protein
MTEQEGIQHGSVDCARQESEAHQLDRNRAELVQELRVIGTGVQILFAFLLGIAFQARFARTTGFQRDDFLVTLMLSGTAAAIFIAPVAVHRLLFRFRVKDEVVNVTNVLAIGGLASLSLALIGAILLVSDWVAGGLGAGICTGSAAFVLLTGWLYWNQAVYKKPTAASFPWHQDNGYAFVNSPSSTSPVDNCPD